MALWSFYVKLNIQRVAFACVLLTVSLSYCSAARGRNQEPDVTPSVADSCHYDYSNRVVVDAAMCFRRIREVLNDKQRFFFGEAGATDECGHDDVTGFLCYSPPVVGFNNSISDMLFPDSVTSSGDRINPDRFLFVEYEADTMTYSGCGTTVTAPAARIKLDFTLEEQLPVHVRHQPYFVYFHASDDDFHTLLVFSVGFGKIYWAVINIPGNRIQDGRTVFAYRGPTNMRFEPDPCVFLVFRQRQGNMPLTTRWQATFENGNIYLQVGDFQQENSLIGPIAVNILLMTTDAYGVTEFHARHPEVAYNCAAFAELAVNHQNLDFLQGLGPLHLTSFLFVHFINEELSFFYCCESHLIEQEDFILDSTSGNLTDSFHIRQESDILITVKHNVFEPNMQTFSSSLYTVVILDADHSVYRKGTEAEPFINYLAFNLRITRNDHVTGFVELPLVEASNVFVPWLSPKPTDRPIHRYFVLLMKQPGRLTYSDVAYYAGATCKRCRFRFREFASYLDLYVSGISWVRIENDAFINWYLNIAQNETCPEIYANCESEELAVGLACAVTADVTILTVTLTAAVLVNVLRFVSYFMIHID